MTKTIVFTIVKPNNSGAVIISNHPQRITINNFTRPATARASDST